jgi:hypothetical protein
MSKLLHKDKKTKGAFFENDDMRMEIKYDDESIQRELIKIIPKRKEVIFSSEDILAIIKEQFKQKDLAAALSTADTSFVPSVEVAVPISFNANKDINEGELVQFFAPMIMPMGIALVMEANRLCMVKGKEVLKIPIEEFEEAKKTLVEESKEFVEKYFKPQIDALKKKREELGQTD